MALPENRPDSNSAKDEKIKQFIFTKMKKVTRKDYLFFSLSVLISAALILSILLTYERKYVKVKLFFLNSNTKKLEIEKKCIVFTKNKVEMVRRIIEELIAGPVDAKYERLFAPDVDIQFVAIGKDGTVYISFNWDFINGMYSHPAAVVQSLAKSLEANLKAVHGVKILIDGVETICNFGGVRLYEVFK